MLALTGNDHHTRCWPLVHPARTAAHASGNTPTPSLTPSHTLALITTITRNPALALALTLALQQLAHLRECPPNGAHGQRCGEAVEVHHGDVGIEGHLVVFVGGCSVVVGAFVVVTRVCWWLFESCRCLLLFL